MTERESRHIYRLSYNLKYKQTSNRHSENSLKDEHEKDSQSDKIIIKSYLYIALTVYNYIKVLCDNYYDLANKLKLHQ